MGYIVDSREKMKKRPLVAAVLSFLIAGLGHLYLGKFSRGLIFLFLELITTWLWTSFNLRPAGLILNLLISFVAAFDAYKIAKGTNKREILEKESKKSSMTHEKGKELEIY